MTINSGQQIHLFFTQTYRWSEGRRARGKHAGALGHLAKGVQAAENHFSGNGK